MKAVFPNEILEMILSHLKGSHNTLLNCRLVSKTFKTLADEVLNDNAFLWKPVMEDDFSSFLKRVKGTRFLATKQITSFLRETENFRNPFPNGTVILYPEPYQMQPYTNLYEMAYPQRTQNDFYESFSTFVEIHKDLITTLVYSFNPQVSYKGQVECILKMRNLKHLAILVGSSGEPIIDAEWFNRIADFKLEFVKEFIMFGNINFERTGMSSTSPLRALLLAVLDSVQCLRFCHGDQWEMEWKCPKLKILELSGFRKLELIGVEGEMPLLKLEASPNLRELIVKFPNNPFYCTGLAPSIEYLFSLLRERSEKLEKLRLAIGSNTLCCYPSNPVTGFLL